MAEEKCQTENESEEQPTEEMIPAPIVAETSDHGATSPKAESNASVANLRGWLDGFGKQNREHFEKQRATSATADVKLSPIRRPTVRKSFETGPTPLPDEAANLLARRLIATNRHQPKKQTQDEVTNVQATDEGYASVAELSKWLADDPTSSKKVRHLRRGANILAKARAFDKGLSNTVAIENKIHRGCVSSHKKRWESKTSNDTETVSAVSRDKQTPKFVHQYAQSEIITGKERADFGGTAKKKWRDRPKDTLCDEHPVLKPSVSVDTTKSASIDGPPSWKSECSLRSSRSASSRGSRTSLSSRRSSRSPRGMKEVVKPNSPVGFFKARELLVKRAIANGSNVDVIVQRRKAKFEGLSKEARRSSTTGHGLLKPSWDTEDGTYVKKFVSDIPAKKSFEDLP